MGKSGAGPLSTPETLLNTVGPHWAGRASCILAMGDRVVTDRCNFSPIFWGAGQAVGPPWSPTRPAWAPQLLWWGQGGCRVCILCAPVPTSFTPGCVRVSVW